MEAEGTTFTMAPREDLECFKQTIIQTSWRMVNEGKGERNEVGQVDRA